MTTEEDKEDEVPSPPGTPHVTVVREIDEETEEEIKDEKNEDQGKKENEDSAPLGSSLVEGFIEPEDEDKEE